MLVSSTAVLQRENWDTARELLEADESVSVRVVFSLDGVPDDPRLTDAPEKSDLLRPTFEITPSASLPLSDFERFRGTAGFNTFRITALKLLNRKDLSGTFRLLDREPFFQATLLNVIEVLRRQSPNLVVFPVTPHEFVPYLIWEAAKWLGFKVLFFQPSSMAPAQRPRNSLTTDLVLPESTHDETPALEHVLKVLGDTVEKFEQKIPPRYMELQAEAEKKSKKAGSRLSVWLFAFRWMRVDRFPGSIDLPGLRIRPNFIAQGIKVIATAALQKSLKRAARENERQFISDRPYALFALHYEPERTSIPEGLDMDFQGHAIARARQLLPPEIPLFVKEHPSQVSPALRGFIGRSPLLYPLINSLPNTFMISDRLGAEFQLGGATVAFTLTGTVGIEGPLGGTPVAYFGAPWWEGMPGTYRVLPETTWTDISSLPIANSSEIGEFLRFAHTRRMVPGIGAESVETIEKRLGPLPDGFLTAEARGIVRIIKTTLLEK